MSGLKVIKTTSTPYISFSYAFSGCINLEYLDMSNFDFSVINNPSSNNMFRLVPTNCLIYVKNQTAKDWFTTNWPSLTNVQIKSEYIANQGA